MKFQIIPGTKWFHPGSGKVFNEENGGTIPVALVDMSNEPSIVKHVQDIALTPNIGEAYSTCLSKRHARDVLRGLGLLPHYKGGMEYPEYSKKTAYVEILESELEDATAELADLRAHVAELNSKYASAEADGNSLREEREKLIARVAELEKDRERLDWLCDNPVQEISFGQFPQSIIFNGECFIDVRAAIDAARAKEAAT